MASSRGGSQGCGRAIDLCLIYRSAAEQTAALVPFLKAGLAAGERCLFAGHGTSGRRLERALRRVAGSTSRANATAAPSSS